MIIINKSGYLKYKNLKFKCAFGKPGVGIKKRRVTISLLEAILG